MITLSLTAPSLSPHPSLLTHSHSPRSACPFYSQCSTRLAHSHPQSHPPTLTPSHPTTTTASHTTPSHPHTHSNDALSKNQALEMERNRERFQFLKWGAKAFKNMLIVPPGSGSCTRWSVCLSVCLFVCLFVCLSVCLCVCLLESVQK